MRPEKLGALAQLAEQRGVLDKVTPDMTGEDFMRMLQRTGSNKDVLQGLKDAGVPATFFLRGGRRGSLPDKLDPSDFNFVVHDQDKLGAPDFREFAGGGSV